MAKKQKKTKKVAPKAAKKTTKKTAKKTTKKSAPKSSSTGPAMSEKNLILFEKKLEEMRGDLLRMVEKSKAEVLPESEVGDEADVAVRSLARDLVFELSGNERHMLEEVEAALRRIEKGVFGLCEATGKKISLARLKVIPYARYCIEYQMRFENS